MPTDSTENKTTLLDGLLEPFGECLTLEVAEKLVQIRANPEIVARVEELAEKCNEGKLTTDERDEYESYIHVNNAMMMMKAKARKFLQANRRGLIAGLTPTGRATVQVLDMNARERVKVRQDLE